MTKITIHNDKPGVEINPAMWGIFFEDINFGADGGLYAELVKNRGFEFPSPLMGWQKICPSNARGSISILNEKPFNPANAHFLRMESTGADEFGVANEGFHGMGVKCSEAYHLSFQVRKVSGNPGMRIALYGCNGALLCETHLKDFADKWQERKAVLRPSATDEKAKLYLLMEGEGTLDIDFVSLFPENTWKKRPGGLRADMVQALADLKPGFLRFPGGCIVEGSILDYRYQWKKTLGPVEERQTLINRWNYEFRHRPAPDYFQSFGLGFYEYFVLCEDIGAAPLPIINCGMACQFNSGELAPMEELDTYIQDALDLVEFANGPVSSEWGGKRAELGHPEPFNMKVLGIGNEQWGPQYIERYKPFVKALKAKYPEIELIAACGPLPNDERFHYLWPKFKELKADVVDEHCYDTPAWFYENTHRYDDYDRKGPKVFFGEYAAQSDFMTSVHNVNSLECALSEAAFMIGMERNADVVKMASYAPLFAHKEGWQWTPDMIWVDNLNLVRTVNYYVQQMFCLNRGDETIPLDISGVESDTQVFAGAVCDFQNGEIIVKLVNPADAPQDVDIVLEKDILPEAREIVLAGPCKTATNSFTAPDAIKPVEVACTLPGNQFSKTLQPRSFTILRIKMA